MTNDTLSVLKYSGKYIRYQLPLFLISPFILLFSAVRPFLIRFLIDDIVGKSRFEFLGIYIATLIGVTFIEHLFTLLGNYMYYKTANRVVVDEQNALFEKLLKVPMWKHTYLNTGDLMSRVLNDVPEMAEVLGIAIAVIFSNVFTLFLVSGVLIYFCWKLALVTFIMLPVYYFSLKAFNRKIRETAKKEREKYAKLTESFREKIEGIWAIKGLNKINFFKELFSKDVNKWFKAKNSYSFFSRCDEEVVGFIASLTPALVLGFGGYLIMKGQLTLGTLIGFYSYVGWLYSPVRVLSQYYVSLQRTGQILRRIDDIYKLPEENEKSGVVLLESDVKTVAYENVSFSYNNSPVLKNINFIIRGRERVAIVGASGSGKSTILSLLPRFYEVSLGKILINDKNIKEYVLENLRRNVIIVKQNDFLFNMSIRENIALGDKFSEEEFKEAVKIACVDKFVNELKNGYETLVGERGMKLSDGQRQRVAIARAVIRKPKVLILDEATSGVDSKTEEEIFKNLFELNTTLVIVSHRLSTIKKANKIFVVDNGEIICEGDHDELLKNCMEYRQIIQGQLIK